MSKEYFSHDYGTRNKTKMSALLHVEKSRGYGLFWIIIEMIYEDSKKSLELAEYTYIAIQKESGEEIDFIKDFIQKCLTTYQVFIEKKGRITSERVLRNIRLRDDLKEKRSFAGKESAKKRLAKTLTDLDISTSVEQKQTSVEQNSTQSNKEKEIKGNESKVKNKANAFASAEAKSNDPEIKKKYTSLVEKLSGKEIKEVWEELKKFIKEEKPMFIDPYHDAWNIFASWYKLSKIETINDTRRKKFKTRVRDESFDFMRILDKIKSSNHLKGIDAKTNWRVTFDWILENDSNYLRILEGAYDNG